MINRYRIGRRKDREIKQRTRSTILFLVLAFLSLSGYALFKFMQDDSVPLASPMITREYAAPVSQINKAFSGATFTFQLPDDWTQKTHTTTPFNYYMWQATKKNYDNRTVELYVDALPPNKAFNRMLPVTADNHKVTSIGTLSENCTTFVDKKLAASPTAAANGYVSANWQGVTFQCDIASASRNVVGAGVEKFGPGLRLTGPSSSHTYYVIFTDHNNTPDYQILKNALTSLTSK